MKFKLHDASDCESDDSNHEEEPTRKQSSSQKTPIVKATVKSMVPKAVSPPLTQVQDSSDSAPQPQDPLTQKIADLEAALLSKTSQMSKKEQEHEEIVRLMSEQLDEAYEQLRSEDLKDFQIETLEERNMELTKEKSNLISLLITETAAREGEAPTTQLEKFSALLTQAQDPLARKIAVLEADLHSKTFQISKMEREHKETVREMSERLDVYERLCPDSQDLKDAQIEILGKRNMELKSIIQANTEEAELQRQKILHLEGSIDEIIENRNGSRTETSETKTEMLRRQVDDLLAQREDLRTLLSAAEGTMSNSLEENLAQKCESLGWKVKRLTEEKANLMDFVGTLGSDPTTQPNRFAALLTQDPLTRKIADLEAALQSKTSQISKMEQEHEETVRLMSEQLDSFYQRLHPNPEDDSQDVKDIKIEILEERIAELQSIIKTKSEESDLQNQKMRKLTAHRDDLQKLLEISKKPVDLQIDALEERNAELQAIIQVSSEEAELQEARRRKESEELREQVKTLAGQKYRLQQLLEAAEAPGPVPAVTASEGSNSNTENLKLQCEDLKRDVYKLTQRNGTLKSLLQTEIDAREANSKEMSRLRDLLAELQKEE